MLRSLGVGVKGSETPYMAQGLDPPKTPYLDQFRGLGFRV